jgi:hypothetical protein
MNKPTNLKEARRLIDLAKDQMDKASVHAWAPSDPAQCVIVTFYAYENCIVGVAEAIGITWTKVHSEKSKLAANLVKDKKLKTDVSKKLKWLNTLRKDVSYGEPGEKLNNVDLEELVSDLESFIEEAETFVEELENE